MVRSFTLLNFLLGVQKTIEDVFYSVNKERSITLWFYCKDDPCTQKCAQVFNDLKDQNPRSSLRIVPISPPKFKEAKMIENNPAIIITFKAKAIFTDTNSLVRGQKSKAISKTNSLVRDQEWTMEWKEEELKWKLVHVSEF
ncbi:NTF2-like domain protein [Raphanus sativus]|nr:NTF2-like domain protein [Raphanus sativus]